MLQGLKHFKLITLFESVLSYYADNLNCKENGS
jgi:hypothetical protein